VRLSGNASRTLEDGRLPGVVVKYRLAELRVGQVRIALKQRFHKIHYTRLGSEGNCFLFTLILNAVAQ
jgi:hypothetical protein